MACYEDVTAMVLAGGFGTRLRSVVADRPKALAEVLGRPYVFHLLDRLVAAGLRRVVICTGHMADLLEEAVGATYRGLKILYSREDAPLGTGGALSLAISRHHCGTVLVINGDSLTDAPLEQFLSVHAQSGARATLLLVQVPDSGRFGRVETDDSGRVSGFSEKGASGPGWISAGFYLLDASILNALPPGSPASLENDVFPGLAAAGLLYGHKVRARFLDIGTPECYAKAGPFLLGERRWRGTVFLTERRVLVSGYCSGGIASLALRPGVVAALNRLRALGVLVVLLDRQTDNAGGARDAGCLLDLLEEGGSGLDAVYPFASGASLPGAGRCPEGILPAGDPFSPPFFVIETAAELPHDAPAGDELAERLLLRMSSTEQPLLQGRPVPVAGLEAAAALVEIVLSVESSAIREVYDHL